MNIVTGCSGIDAIAYTATLLDIDVIGQIEIDTFCNQILELRYPGVKRLRDVFDVRGDEFGTVDIFAAGIPCQPFSHAGKRGGSSDDRYLWPEAIRIIRVMQPSWVIVENVDGIGSMEQPDYKTVVETETDVCTEAEMGLLSEIQTDKGKFKSKKKIVVEDHEMVLEAIKKDLEEAGYRSIPIVIPAASVGAPHQRYRYFVVAYTRGNGLGKQGVCGEQQGRTKTIGTGEIMGNSISRGFDREPRRRSGQEPADRHSGIEAMADAERQRLQTSREGRSRRIQSGNQKEYGSQVESGGNGATPGRDVPQSRLGGNADGLSGGLHGPGGQEDGSGVFGAFEAIFTAVLGQILWPAGYGAGQYDYEPPRVAMGIKNRTNRLKALGNSIVPWQIFSFLLAIKLLSRANLPELCGGEGEETCTGLRR
jgi:DNA (cytosine-5)-methyltransferase 1